jgi:zinc-RING finger domain
MTIPSPSNNNVSLDARFSCNICFDAVTEPVVTQCGHLYCWPCLYRWLDPGMYPAERVRLGLRPNLIQPDSGRRSCPVCKAGCSVDTIVPIYVRAIETTTSNISSIPSDKNIDDENNGSNVNTLPAASDVDVTNEFSIDDIPAGLGDVYDSDEIDLQPEFTTGLRQRRASTMDSQSSILSDVPRRPLPQSPDRAAMTASPPPTNNAVIQSGVSGANTSLALSPAISISSHNQHHPQTASLSHGILAPFVQEAMRRSSVPAIHRPEGFNSPDLYSQSIAESDPGATQFLSRLLLMLGSFVIMCLLLF